MSKEGDIDTAIGQLRISKTGEQETRILGALWEDGHTQGMLDVDSKLDEALGDIKTGNDKLSIIIPKLARACEERDIFLAQFTQLSHMRAVEALIQSGFHPQVFHNNPKHQVKIGKVRCRMCNDNIVGWKTLPDDIKKSKMGVAYRAVMKSRAEEMLAKGAMSETSPTTHQIAGVAKPVEPPVTPNDLPEEKI